MMSHQKTYLRELLAKRASHKLSEAEGVVLQTLMEAPEVKEWFPQVDELNYNSPDADVLSPLEKERMLQNILPNKSRRKYAIKWWLAAAVLVLPIGIYLLRMWNMVPENRVHYTNTSASIQEITLSDGSQLILNEGSSATFQMHQAQRRLGVIGEAYVQVVPNAKEPFVVHGSNGLEIQVLGTAFGVQTVGAVQTVVLEQGKVRIVSPQLSNQEAIFLEPGKRLRLHADGSYQVDEVNPSMLLSWTESLLSFEDAPLQDVLIQLTKIFPIQYENQLLLNPKITQLHFTGYLPKDDLRKSLQILNETLQIHLIQELSIIRLE